jgi:hypothetical protein
MTTGDGNKGRSRDLDHDDRVAVEDSEEDEDITLSQNARPPTYFPPVDFED